MRLRQEMVLGIGGWRLLRELGLSPDVCHLNEGHAALAVLERARSFMEEANVPFETALVATRAGNLFTTHTAVPAGFDRFEPSLVERYLGRYATTLGIPMRDLLALGRLDANDEHEPFNMAYLAVRGSGAVNAVSRLHGEVSRQLFAPLFPRRPLREVPISHVTNGVHIESWTSAAADDLWTQACGKGLWRGESDDRHRRIDSVTDADLWRGRNVARSALIDNVREKASRERALAGEPADFTAAAAALLDPNVLTVGFARRFASYKRPTLLLHDAQRLRHLLLSDRRPVQLIIAGKAHPADAAGAAMIREWHRFAAQPDVRLRVVFLADYDMNLAARLVQGADVWLNTPRRPWEASGTSGMKVLPNGGLNLSTLDGWWAEGFDSNVGWAIGNLMHEGDASAIDASDAARLYDLLEREVAPAFYARDSNDVPLDWTRRMRASMASLTPNFSADRTVREYVEQHYLTAAAAHRARGEDRGRLAKEIAKRRHDLARRWSSIRFESVRHETREGRHEFSASLNLGGARHEDLSVELYADADGAHGATTIVAAREDSAGADTSLYRASVPAVRSAIEYTFRVVPSRVATETPLESMQVIWQR